MAAPDREQSKRGRGGLAIGHTHPTGQSKRKRQRAVVQICQADQPQVPETLGGRRHVRWDEGASAMPHGQLAFFAERGSQQFSRQDWSRPDNQGCQMVQAQLRLHGWSARRRVVIVRQPIKGGIARWSTTGGVGTAERPSGRAADPTARTEVIASRPLLLLAAVGKTASHAGQATLYLTPMHGKTNHSSRWWRAWPNCWAGLTARPVYRRQDSGAEAAGAAATQS